MKNEVTQFQVKGEISMWKYIDGAVSDYGWHIYTCPEARKSIISLLQLMRRTEGASSKAIYLVPPTQEVSQSPNNYNDLTRYRYKRILFINSKKDMDNFSINENNIIVEIILGESILQKFKRQLVTNYKGQKNFLTDNKDKDQIITFW